MNASGKSPLDYWGIALRFIALLPESPSRNKCVRSLFFGLLFLLTMPAQATSTIAASTLWCEFGRSLLETNQVAPQDGCTFPTASAANQALADYFTALYSSVNPPGASYVSTGCDESTGWCGLATTYNGTVENVQHYYIMSWTTCPANSSLSSATACTCNTNYVADSAGTSCVLPSQCPANSSGTYPDACTCNDGYEPDPTKTSCVPVSTCPIPGLTPLTDPVAIDFENGTRWRPDKLTADYQTKLKCVQDAIVKKGGTSEGTSAYRPTQYQQHLAEIVKKDSDLNIDYMAAHPECQTLRDEISRAMGPPPGHGLKRKQKVAKPGTSRHESGTAFDVTPSGLTDAQLTLVYTGCGVSHTAVSGEPWHVQ